jgi:hypothetical protein
MEDHIQEAERPVMSGFLLAVVLFFVGLGAVAILVLAAAAVVFR